MTADLTVASIYADLLGTYGDAGNLITLLHRGQLHGLTLDVVQVQPGDPVPEQADVYLLGGGEDTAQVAACNALRSDGAVKKAADAGAVIFAVCAGYQLLGEYFPDANGQPSAGLGLIDIRTERLPQRAVGELAAESMSSQPPSNQPRLTGYENHAGGTTRGESVAPLGRVLAGIGNGDGTEGSVSGHVLGTYLHGPCLVRNPEIADQLLGWALGRELPALDEPEVTALREERLRTVLGH